MTARYYKVAGHFEPGFPTVGMSGTVKYRFWTNFSKQRSSDFEVLEYDPEIPGYWSFETNLEKDDFEFMLTPERVKRFLYQMADIYRSPDV